MSYDGYSDNSEDPDEDQPVKEEEKPLTADDVLKILISKKDNVVNEKLLRCKEFKLGKYGHVPLCYLDNSPKEELVLEHVIQYAQQFKYVYDENRELFLYPKNECDLYKFICTTLRPTKLGYLELYDYQKAAQFLADFMQYEELDPPDQYPKVIPSPTNVLKWQKGDCFDLSIVLASILIGTGHDAYVIFGTADRIITTKDESRMEYLFLEKGMEFLKQKDTSGDSIKENEFFKKEIVKTISDFDTREYQQKMQEELERHFRLNTIDDETPEPVGHDPYVFRRKHCWVLLKAGKRGVQQNIFIEPSTGRLYPTSSPLFLTVDSLFNNQNYWINLRPGVAAKDLNLDELNVPENWEYVMLDTLVFASSEDHAMDEDADPENANNQEKASNDDEADLKEIQQVLDMPPAWPPKLNLDYEQYFRGTPLGETFKLFSKVKVETFAPYSQVDGLTRRVTLYEDYKRLKAKEIRYFFEHRKDRMRLKIRHPFEYKTTEYFDPGKPPHWKMVTEVDRVERRIVFYPHRHHDGLIERIEKIGSKTIERYQNRDDRIIQRSVRFERKVATNKDKLINDTQMSETFPITKLTQKYEKNPHLPAREQVQKMVVNMNKQPQLVQLYYHMEEGDLAPIYAEYERDTIQGYSKGDSTGEKKVIDPVTQEKHSRIQSMENEAVKQVQMQERNNELELGEKKNYEVKINGFRATNNVDEANKEILEKTLHDKAKEKYKLGYKSKEDELEEDAAAKDYLYPILKEENLLSKQYDLSEDDAKKIKKKALDKCKERILARADIIHRRLEAMKAKLAEEEAKTKKPITDQNEEKRLDENISKLHFVIEILDQRAHRFEMLSLAKYQKLAEDLEKDDRLSKTHKK